MAKWPLLGNTGDNFFLAVFKVEQGRVGGWAKPPPGGSSKGIVGPRQGPCFVHFLAFFPCEFRPPNLKMGYIVGMGGILWVLWGTVGLHFMPSLSSTLVTPQPYICPTQYPTFKYFKTVGLHFVPFVPWHTMVPSCRGFYIALDRGAMTFSQTNSPK